MLAWQTNRDRQNQVRRVSSGVKSLQVFTENDNEADKLRINLVRQ